MNANISKLSNIELLEFYNKLVAKKREFEQDIVDTKKALEFQYIDYMTKMEYQRDIMYDRHEIAIINIELEDLITYANTRGIELETEEEKVKRLSKKIS